MKNINLLINIVAEYFSNIVEWFLFRKKEPSFLACSVSIFTHETWLESVYRQGKLMEYLYHGKTLDSSEEPVKVIEAA